MSEKTLNSTSASSQQAGSTFSRRLRNVLIALSAVILSVALFLGFRTQATSVSLPALAEASIPLEVALSNEKPTFMEFYADWCTSCQLMAEDIGELKQQYGEQINFVMLNVDNSKWLPEMLHYGVDGIPHFVFLNRSGEAIAMSIGEQPHSVLDANLEALASGTSLPYTQASGRASEFSTSGTPARAEQVDPRSHGG